MKKNSQYVLSHALNNSKTKQSHAFGKSNRFAKVTQSPCIKASYDLTQSAIHFSRISSLSKFGRDSRFRQTEIEIKRRSLSPSPNTYVKDSFVDSAMKNNKGQVFGRDKKMKLENKEVPGPGKYNANVYNPEANLAYSMRNKPKKDETHWNKVGPGQYNTHSSQILNKVKKSSHGYQIARDKRFKNHDSGVPEPGRYNIGGRMATEPTSKFLNSNQYSFGNSRRRNMTGNESQPGPGAYNSFSQFTV